MISEAQQIADKKYRQKINNSVLYRAMELKTDESYVVDELVKEHGMSHAQFIRWALMKLKEE